MVYDMHIVAFALAVRSAYRDACTRSRSSCAADNTPDSNPWTIMQRNPGTTPFLNIIIVHLVLSTWLWRLGGGCLLAECTVDNGSENGILPTLSAVLSYDIHSKAQIYDLN